MEAALKCFLNTVSTKGVQDNKYFLEDCLKILNMVSIGNEANKLI